MNKKYILLTTALAALSLSGCGNKITQTADTMTVELGADLDFNAADYFNANENILNELAVDSSQVDTSEVGSGEITVTYKNDAFKITVNVEDTTAPVVTEKEELSAITDGETITASDYATADDLSDCKIYFIIEDSETEEITFTSDMTDSDTFDVEIIAVDSSDNKSDPITVSIPVSTTVSIQGCTYDASTNTYHITEEVAGELSARYPEIMGKVTVNADLENAFYDYIFGKNMETEIDWGVMDIIMKAFDGVEPEDFLSDAGLYKKPSTSTSGKKDTVSQPAQTKPAQTKPAQSQPAETQAPTQSNPPEDTSSGMMSGDDLSAWLSENDPNYREIGTDHMDWNDYGDVGIH